MGYKVFIPKNITDAGKDYLRSLDYDLIIGTGTDMETMLREGGAADAILARTEQYPRELLEQMPNLKVIGRHGIGTDNIDVSYCTGCGIKVTYAPNSNANSVAEHTIAMMLACACNLPYQDRQTRAGDWETRNRLIGMDLENKTLGIIGLGRIGRLVAEKATLGLKMNVIGYDAFLASDKYPPYIIKSESFEDLLPVSDFVTLHVPATAETKKLINAASLAKMKKTAYIINMARGEVVDEAALFSALKNKVIAGAALDVFEQEPAQASNPLFSLDNVIVSPHSAALTQEAMDRMGLHAAMGIHAVLSGGKPEWPVN